MTDFEKHDKRGLNSALFKSLPVEDFQNFSYIICVVIVIHNMSSCYP